MTNEEAIDVLKHNYPSMCFTELCEAVEIAIQALSAQPERKKGKWIPMFNGEFMGGAYWFGCSNCGRIVPDVRNGGWKFCPNCGARMKEGEQDG